MRPAPGSLSSTFLSSASLSESSLIGSVAASSCTIPVGCDEPEAKPSTWRLRTALGAALSSTSATLTLPSSSNSLNSASDWRSVKVPRPPAMKFLPARSATVLMPESARTTKCMVMPGMTKSVRIVS